MLNRRAGRQAQAPAVPIWGIHCALRRGVHDFSVHTILGGAVAAGLKDFKHQHLSRGEDTQKNLTARYPPTANFRKGLLGYPGGGSFGWAWRSWGDS